MCNTNKNMIKMGVIIKKVYCKLFSSQCQLTSITLMPPPQLPPPLAPWSPHLRISLQQAAQIYLTFIQNLFFLYRFQIYDKQVLTQYSLAMDLWTAKWRRTTVLKANLYGFYRTNWQTFCSSVFMTAVICPMPWTAIISAVTPLLPPTNRSCFIVSKYTPVQ